MTISQSTTTDPLIAGIILCGGKSSRMGRPKWSLPIGDETCLQRTIRILREVTSPIIAVAAEDQPITGLPADVTLVRDQIPEKGPLAGLSAGLEYLQKHTAITSAYVTSCDAPLLNSEFIASVIDQLGDHDLAVVKEGKFYHPLAGVYRVSLSERVASLLAEDRLRPLFLIEESNSREIDIEELRDVDPNLDSLRNMNKPEDYRSILESLDLPIPAWLS
ncbi:MAG: molybdenum cofactor guanylyltransferase [Planctomycetaceae bacterium]|nr:molybdenum cofactor guanylyltransferase [Planctomycetaceae bacterium]